MTGISRATLPQNFYDYTSAQMLVQPEPQYLYAQLFMGALAISLQDTEGLALPGRKTMSAGAAPSSAEADRLMLAEAIKEDLFQIRVDYSAEPGHTVKFNRPRFVNTTYTKASRQIPTGSTISTEAIAVTAEQVKLDIERFGGPYDSANSRIAPLAIEQFDAQMGVHDMFKIAGVHFKRDFHRFLDKVYVDICGLGNVTVYPSETITADNDMTTAQPLTYEQLSRTAQKMDDADLPRLPDGKRLLVCSPTGKKQLKDDPQFAEYARENRDTNPLIPGWFDTIDDFHCCLSTTLDSTDNSSSIAVKTAHAIAPGALAGGVGRPPRVMGSTDDNFGETVKAIWLADLAMGLADNRFVYLVKHTEDV